MTEPNKNHPWYEQHLIKSTLVVITIFGGIWATISFFYNEKSLNLNNQILSAKTTAETYKAQKELAEQKLKEIETKKHTNNSTSPDQQELDNLKKANHNLEAEVAELKDKIESLQRSYDSETYKIQILQQKNEDLIKDLNKAQDDRLALVNNTKEAAANSPIRIETHRKGNSTFKTDYPLLLHAQIGEAVTDKATKATISINNSSGISHMGTGILTPPNQPPQPNATFRSGQVIPYEFDDQRFVLRMVRIDTFDYTIQIDEN